MTTRISAADASAPSAAGRCPDCRGSGRLPGPDATGAEERCPWCDGSGAATE